MCKKIKLKCCIKIYIYNCFNTWKKIIFMPDINLINGK